MRDTIRNVNIVHAEKMSTGDKVADAVANTIGSWHFIIIQSIIVLIWISGNLWILTHPFDIYPFILLNLLFSTQAAYASPLIMMSQNRQSAKDRLMAEHDYQTNEAAKQEIEQILTHLSNQDDELLKHTHMLTDLLTQHIENQDLTEITHYLDQQNTLYAQLVQELQQKPLDVRVTTSALPHDERKGNPA